MTELQFKKKMQHLLEMNTKLYQENQKLKKEIESLKELLKPFW